MRTLNVAIEAAIDLTKEADSTLQQKGSLVITADDWIISMLCAILKVLHESINPNRGIKQTVRKKTVHNVAHAGSNDGDEMYSFTIYTVGGNGKLPHAAFKVMGKQVNMMIDTGATINIVNPDTYAALGRPKIQYAKLKSVWL